VKQYLLKLFLPGQQNQILCLPNHLVLYSTVKGQNPFEISEENLVTSVRMSEYLANEHKKRFSHMSGTQKANCWLQIKIKATFTQSDRCQLLRIRLQSISYPSNTT